MWPLKWIGGRWFVPVKPVFRTSGQHLVRCIILQRRAGVYATEWTLKMTSGLLNLEGVWRTAPERLGPGFGSVHDATAYYTRSQRAAVSKPAGERAPSPLWLCCSLSSSFWLVGAADNAFWASCERKHPDVAVTDDRCDGAVLFGDCTHDI